MALPAAFGSTALLLLCDVALLSVLDRWRPSLPPLGVQAAWLEAGLRLMVLLGARGLLSLARPPQAPPAALVTLSLLPALYTSVGHWFGDPPLLLSSAPRAWLLLGYGAVGLACVTWGALERGGSHGETKKEDRATLRKLLRLFRPDAPYLGGAFACLTMAVIGETFIPYYTGRVIDILGQKYNSEAFSDAIFLVCLVSLGSSLFAGCRGGLFMLSFSRMNVRVRGLLFSSLVRQDLAFFQEVKTGEAPRNDPVRPIFNIQPFCLISAAVVIHRFREVFVFHPPTTLPPDNAVSLWFAQSFRFTDGRTEA